MSVTETSHGAAAETDAEARSGAAKDGDDRSRPTPSAWRAALPGLGLVGALSLIASAVAAFGPAGTSPLVVGVVLGVIVANASPVVAIQPTASPGITFAAKQLLRVGIVVLGLRLSLQQVADIGVAGVGVVALTVAVTFFGTQWLGRRLGLGRDLSLLVATGYSICGASAIAAVDGVVEAEEEEVAYAVGLVTLCGTLAMVALPLAAGPLDLVGHSFGAWVGASVHDVAQVVAASATAGEEASAAAIVVKLTRVALLAPLVAGVAAHRRRNEITPVGEKRPAIVPWFVVAFIGAVLVRTSGVLGDEALDVAKTIEKALLTMALVGLGLGVRVTQLRRLGARPLALGLLSWVLVAAISYVGVRVSGL